MIAVDMKLPERCADCPCSYWIRSGDYEGMLMCPIMESKLENNGIDRTGKCIVNEFDEKRPADCPIVGEIGVVVWHGTGGS